MSDVNMGSKSMLPFYYFEKGDGNKKKQEMSPTRVSESWGSA